VRLVRRMLVAIGVVALYAQDSSRSVWDGVFSEDQAKAGQADYLRSCASCHGDTLTGGDEAPSLAGGAFLSNWNGLTVGELFERIRTTMPINDPPSVGREVKTRILAYLLKMNRFPSGGTELSARTEAMRLIRIEADEPKKQ
jgi:S-disulfanyl-L-cysteine oxidoreductase SoxD